MQEQVERTSTDFLTKLARGDLLFVDSTHTLGPTGEVTRIITQMLPLLADGVRVHFHDIWFTYDYSPQLLEREMFFWHETALMLGFLTLNTRFRVVASLSQLHHERSREMQRIFPRFRPMPMAGGLETGYGDYPSSLFLEVGPVA
jgi:hypothetical protein